MNSPKLYKFRKKDCLVLHVLNFQYLCNRIYTVHKKNKTKNKNNKTKTQIKPKIKCLLLYSISAILALLIF